MNSPENKKVIVLIEDESAMANILMARLERAGFVAHLARDGADGLDLIHRIKPDLVLLDMLLPRIDGMGVLIKLNEEHILPDLPVIMISNSGQPIEIDKANRLGIRDYLVKINFDPNEIIEKVNAIFSGAPRVSQNVGPLGKVLLIEDDSLLHDLIRQKLLKAGFIVFGATDAEGARGALQTEHVDLILLDIMLPGVDGLTLLKEFKENESSKKIPVIIISNLGQQEEIQRGLDAGAIAYMVKANSTTTEIVEKVRQHISAQS